MSIVIHIGEDIRADSTDTVLDFIEACVEEGADIDDLVASMLCAISAILESEAINKESMN